MTDKPAPAALANKIKEEVNAKVSCSIVMP